MIVFLDPLNWDGTEYLDNPSWAEASVPKSATDSLTVIAADTAYTPVEPAVSGPYIDPVSWAGLYSDPVSWGDAAFTPVAATDTLVPGMAEVYQLSGSGPAVKTATDTLVAAIVEAPTAARLILTDEAMIVGSTETAISPTGTPVTASDSLLVSLGEGFHLATGGVALVTASDVLQPLANEALLLPIVRFSSISASDTLVPAIADAKVALLTPFVVTASEVLLVGVAETAIIIGHAAPVAGILPPGWIEYEEEELTGIAHPWRVEPRNVTPHQGWFKRKYWAIDDETGRRRVTDRWRNAARAQAWTQYHSGKQSAAA